MSSAVKTLELLSLFSTARPEIGLSHLCRLAGRDKATTYRHLQALESMGFVEQNPETRQYRLGPALLQLAAMREATVPRKSAAEAVVSALAAATGETAHVSVLSGQTLHVLAASESPRHSTRVIIDITTFPLHATASGLCALAFGPATLMEGLMQVGAMQAFTARTPVTPDDLRRRVEEVATTGLALSDGSFEADVQSLGAPVFGPGSGPAGGFAGAVSVATVATRFSPDHEKLVRRHLIAAARNITQSWGGTVPARLSALWDAALPLSPELDPVT